MLSVQVETNFPPLADEKLLTREDWAAIGRMGREQILRHTAAGKDEDGNAFAPYSKGYAKRRRKAGHSDRVSLSLSGGMLGAIVVEPDDTGCTLAFSN